MDLVEKLSFTFNYWWR